MHLLIARSAECRLLSQSPQLLGTRRRISQRRPIPADWYVNATV
ncbi:Uncharacterised protein [Vibrio cholerae]|nr:Uncharacterised protein [Vibrio cholerae]